MMTQKFIKCTIADQGREILIRTDAIAAVAKNSFCQHSYGTMGQYWTAKIIMTSGKEFELNDRYDTIIKEWTEESLCE
jgi:hypothetical protein